MARKHKAKALAQQRIEYLYTLAHTWLDDGRIQDCQTAIKHIKKLATSHVISITEIKRHTCKNCNVLLKNGVTAQTRIHNDQRVITCTQCKSIKRVPY